MPQALIRNGNAYISSASFSKSHGVTPTQCKVTFEGVTNIPLGTPYSIDIGGSVWMGIFTENHVHKSEGLGQVTEATCNDVREFLMSNEVFCDLNEIDRKTGDIFCILDDQFISALVALGYIGQGQANSNYGTWQQLQPFGVWSTIYPQTVIEVLCYLTGFSPPVFSAAAQTILNSAATVLNSGVQGTLMATPNFFGIDWHLGEKCGSALNHICELLGLQFTLVPGAYQLTFYKIGEASYQGIEWQGFYATETTQGLALQTNVDTGVYITGERDVWEMDKVDVIPAWNQVWNRWGLMGEQWVYEHILKPAGLDLLGTTIGMLKNISTNVSVNYFSMASNGTDQKNMGYSLALSTLYDSGFTDSGFFEDLSIHDYLERVFFKVYRIAIMDQFLTTNEFNGRDSSGNRVPVRFKPIHFPLLTDPSVPYHAYAAIVQKKSKKHTISVSAPKTRREKGHRLSDETGHIVFDNMQYALSAAAITYSGNNQGCLPPPDGSPSADTTTLSSITNIVPDAPALDVCFYGPVFRNTYGTNQTSVINFQGQSITILPRVGNKKVSGLRHGRVCTNAAMTSYPTESTTPWANAGQTVAQYMAGIAEYIANTNLELTAEQEALLVANAWLNRPQVVTSGQEHFAFHAGHEPDGEIRRVSVSVDGSKGIHETVAYANDYPSLFHEPDINLSRQMGIDMGIRQGAKLREQEKYALYKQQQEAEALDEMKHRDGGFDTFHQKRVIVDNHLEVGLVEQIMVLRGEVVMIQQNPTTTNGGENVTVGLTDGSVVDGDQRALSIALGSTSSLPTAGSDGLFGRLNVVSSGQVPALVMGPCLVGAPLCLAATTADKANWSTTGKYLKAGQGNSNSYGQSNFTAMENVPAPSNGKPIMAMVKVQNNVQDMVAVDLAATVNVTVPTTGLTQIDGVTPANGALIFLPYQTTSAQNGVYVWNNGSLLSPSQPCGVFVQAGNTQASTIWNLSSTATNFTYNQMGSGNEIEMIIDGGGSAISTTSPTLTGAVTRIRQNCKIIGWYAMGDAVGPIAVNIVTSNGSGWVTPTNVISASAPPNLGAAVYNSSTTLTGWTNAGALKAGDAIGCTITTTPSGSTTRLSIVLVVQ